MVNDPDYYAKVLKWIQTVVAVKEAVGQPYERELSALQALQSVFYAPMSNVSTKSANYQFENARMQQDWAKFIISANLEAQRIAAASGGGGGGGGGNSRPMPRVPLPPNPKTGRSEGSAPLDQIDPQVYLSDPDVQNAYATKPGFAKSVRDWLASVAQTVERAGGVATPVRQAITALSQPIWGQYSNESERRQIIYRNLGYAASLFAQLPGQSSAQAGVPPPMWGLYGVGPQQQMNPIYFNTAARAASAGQVIPPEIMSKLNKQQSDYINALLQMAQSQNRSRAYSIRDSIVALNELLSTAKWLENQYVEQAKKANSATSQLERQAEAEKAALLKLQLEGVRQEAATVASLIPRDFLQPVIARDKELGNYLRFELSPRAEEWLNSPASSPQPPQQQPPQQKQQQPQSGAFWPSIWPTNQPTIWQPNFPWASFG
jgi:hypothetical protein